jgi:putative endonuclease
MREQNRAKGRIGEDIAVKYLKKHKYQIVERNYSNKLGEIDIIALDGDYLVFVEVKMRETTQFGMPREAVTIYKQRHIIRAAQLYLYQNKLSGVPVRFDIVEILAGEVTLLKDAFWT